MTLVKAVKTKPALITGAGLLIFFAVTLIEQAFDYHQILYWTKIIGEALVLIGSSIFIYRAVKNKS